MTLDPHEVQTESIRYLLAKNAEKDAEIARLASELAAAQAERDSLRTVAESRLMRMRSAAQVLVAEIGAKGPENVDLTAGRAVAVIEALKDELSTARRGPVVGWRPTTVGEAALLGMFWLSVGPGGWTLRIRLPFGLGIGDLVESGPETGPAGKSAAEAAYRKAAGLA